MNRIKWIVHALLALLLSFSFALSAAKLGRDPTQPPAQLRGDSLKVVDEFTVNSILISPKRQIAVIGGQFRVEGDMIGGVRVLSIQPNYVIFARDQQRFKRYVVSTDESGVEMRLKPRN